MDAAAAAETGTRQSADTASQPKAVPSALAAAGILGPILFTVGFVLQDIYRDKYNPVVQQISDLTAGRYGWVQQLSFVLFGGLLIAFAVGLHRGVRKAGTRWVGPAIIACNGVDLVVAGVFPLRQNAAGLIYDPIGVHSVNGTIFFVSIGVGLVVLSRRLARDARWRGLAGYTLTSGITLFAMQAIVGVLTEPKQAPLQQWSGLLQRTTLAVWLLCVVILALRLRRVARAGV